MKNASVTWMRYVPDTSKDVVEMISLVRRVQFHTGSYTQINKKTDMRLGQKAGGRV